MNAFQTCKNTSDIIPLYLPQQLYLKPVAKLNISLQLPNVVKVGKSISHWEIMEKFRELIKPEEFTVLKVSKSTLELVRFEAEVDTRKKLDAVVNKLEHKTIKLKNFSELMRVRAAPTKSDFPNRHAWDGFFQEAKDMNEMKPGERPDTVHIYNLPTKWFIPYHLSDEEDLLPSEKVFYKIFEKFGPIRSVDVPICDPYRSKMKEHISGIKKCNWDNKEFFEGYVQFKDYLGFKKCMDFFKDMKLVNKTEDEATVVDIKVDFDRSKHLSDASIRRREIVRDRLVKKQKEKEDMEKKELDEKKKKEEENKKKELSMKQQKEQRRKLREEKRKAAILEKLKIKGSDEINAKIAREEKKLLKVQRKLESIRLIEELFRRIKDKRESEKFNSYSLQPSEGDNVLRRYKNTSELEVLNQKQKLHNAIQGRVMLKTALQGNDLHEFSSSSSDDMSPRRPQVTDELLRQNTRLFPGDGYDYPIWYGYPYQMPPAHPLYQNSYRGLSTYNLSLRGRGGFRGQLYPGPSRGSQSTRRPRGYRSHHRGGYHGDRYQYTIEMEEEYMKYFSKFLRNEHDDRSNRSRSRSRRSRSRSRRRSYSRGRSYSRSSSRNRKSRSRSHSRPRKSRRSSRSRSRSKKSRSRSHSHRSRRTRSRSGTRNKSTSRRSRRSRTPEKESSKIKERSRSRSNISVDSSKFISPNRMRRERSKSWSLPKDKEKDKRDSWSRSPDRKK